MKYFRSTWSTRYPPPRLTVTNEGLGWDSLLKMVHNPGGHCYWCPTAHCFNCFKGKHKTYIDQIIWHGASAIKNPLRKANFDVYFFRELTNRPLKIGRLMPPPKGNFIIIDSSPIHFQVRTGHAVSFGGRVSWIYIPPPSNHIYSTLEDGSSQDLVGYMLTRSPPCIFAIKYRPFGFGVPGLSPPILRGPRKPHDKIQGKRGKLPSNSQGLQRCNPDMNREIPVWLKKTGA